MLDDGKSDLEIADQLNRTVEGIHYAMRKYQLIRTTQIQNLENEIWKDINGYEGFYQISNYGRVRSLPRWIYYSDGRKYHYDAVLLRQKVDHGGYNLVELTINCNVKTHKVHRLVAEAFIPNPNCLPEVNHKDENKNNNRADNLEWCDNEYNNHYGTRLERIHNIVIQSQGKPVVFTRISDGEKYYYPAIRVSAKDLGLDERSVHRCLKKEPGHKTVKGFKVEYAETI